MTEYPSIQRDRWAGPVRSMNKGRKIQILTANFSEQRSHLCLPVMLFLSISPFMHDFNRNSLGCIFLLWLWHESCEKVGEDIDMYSGVKHSSCSQYINEEG